MNSENNRVVVTGVGAATPLGCDVEAFWSNLLEGRSGIVALPEFAALPESCRIGGRVAGFAPESAFSRREITRLSRTSQLALVAARAAVAQSAIDRHPDGPAKIGVILGVSIGVVSSSEQYFVRMNETGVCDPIAVPASMNLAPAANISMQYGFRGTTLSVDAACASSGHAIGQAFRLIRSGEADVVVTGGADSPFSPFVSKAWSSLQALSTRIETPASACRPFSADRDGFVLGEHAGILVLESEASALGRGAAILAEISGYGASSDASHLTQPTVAGPRDAMLRALEDAGLQATEIDHVNAHGTGTKLNDRIESIAIREALGGHAMQIPVVSSKAALGHSLGASGAVELIACILAIRDGVIPPTINYRLPDPECALDYNVGGMAAREVRHAMSNSFAFGGSNVALIVSRYN